jgi:hypothetical protein
MGFAGAQEIEVGPVDKEDSRHDGGISFWKMKYALVCSSY